jgi:hypothetical protein
MPYFDIEGYGKDTKRKRKRTYMAKDHDDAIRQAEGDGTITEKAEIRGVFGFINQLAGASYKNPDNTSRQRILQSCKRLESLILEHETANPRDVNAIRVLRVSGQQIGYLPADFAAVVMSHYFYGENGCQYSALALTIRPFDDRTSLLTMDILGFVALSTVNTNAISAYIKSYLSKLSVNVHHTDVLPMRILLSKPRPKYRNPIQQQNTVRSLEQQHDIAQEREREMRSDLIRPPLMEKSGRSMRLLALVLLTTLAVIYLAFSF